MFRKILSIALLLMIACHPILSQKREKIELKDVISFESYMDLIETTGGVNPDLILYDFTNFSRAHIGDMICVRDIFNAPTGWSIYQELIGFYELIDKSPNDFAKSIMESSLTKDIPLRWTRHYASIGYELLLGRVWAQDTLLGKKYLSMAISECPSEFDNYVKPFWRDSVYRKEYALRHDSVMQLYGRLWPDTAIQDVIEKGDLEAYQRVMNKQKDGRMMMLAIYVIDQYGYSPAYEDLYTCLQQCYSRIKRRMGPYGFMWMYKVLTAPSAIGVPSELIQKILSDALDYHKETTISDSE